MHADAAEAAEAARRSPGQDDIISDPWLLDARPNLLHDTGAFMAKQVGEIVAYVAILVHQVRMTHAACLHAYKHLAGAGIVHQERLQLSWRTCLTRNNALSFDRHSLPPVASIVDR